MRNVADVGANTIVKIPIVVAKDSIFEKAIDCSAVLYQFFKRRAACKAYRGVRLRVEINHQNFGTLCGESFRKTDDSCRLAYASLHIGNGNDFAFHECDLLITFLIFSRC